MLQVLTGGMALALPGWTLRKNGLWMPDDLLPVTPSQTEGPFYPEIEIAKQLFSDTDLSQKMDGHEFAKGQSIELGGIVRNRKGTPLEGAIVEIWQACSTGRYNHSRDQNKKALLDNNFQFWGRAITGADGRYAFKTIIPGLYQGRMGRHIHFRIDREGMKRLTTQCYFSDYGEDNAKDSLYRQLNAEQRRQLTVELNKSDEQTMPWTGAFDVVLG